MNPTLHSFEISTGPERVVRADVHTSPDAIATIVFGHGFKGFKDWGPWPWLASEWASRGIATCRFNFSLNGVAGNGDTFDEPEKFARQTYGADMEDWRQVILRRDLWGVDTPEETIVVGHSRGGYTGLLAAADRPEVAGACALAAPCRGVRFDTDAVERWRRDGTMEIPNARTGQTLGLDRVVLDDFEKNAGRYDLRSALADRRFPVLVLHGTEDETVPLDEGRDIAEWAPEGHARLVELPGTGHTFGAGHPFESPTPELERICDEVEKFVKEIVVR